MRVFNEPASLPSFDHQKISDDEGVAPSWSQDAIRTAEQIRARFPTRPAMVLIGGLEEESLSGKVALEVSHALAMLCDEEVLLFDCYPNKANVESTGRRQTQADEVVSLGGRVHYTSLGGESSRSSSQIGIVTPGVLRVLNSLRERFPLMVLHSMPLSIQESYALVSRADFSVVVLQRGQSSMKNFEQFYGQTRTLTRDAIGVLMTE